MDDLGGWSGESTTVAGRLVLHASQRPETTALTVLSGGVTTTITWLDLLRASVAHARRYEAEGVLRGDTVLLCLTHGTSLHAAFLGALLVGAVPGYLAVPSDKQDPDLFWASYESLVERISPRLMLVSPDITLRGEIGTHVVIDEPLEALEGTAGELIASYADSDPSAVALLQHSSGTTGLKKGVALTHDQIAKQVAALAARLEVTDADRVASWLPVYHDMGLISSFLAPVHLSIPVLSLDPFEWVNAPHSLLDTMDQHRATLAWLPNFAFNHLVRTKTGDESYRLDHVRAFINCSEPCKPATFDRFAEAFASHGVRRDQLQVSYAMAESVFAVTQTVIGEVTRTLDVDGAQALSNGPLLDGIELRVAAPDGAQVGEIQLRGGYVFSGYSHDAETTAEAFDGDWYRTGDLGCLVDGELYVLGRVKDVIIHHGINYFAHDIEAAVTAVPGVKSGRCVAVAVYDPDVGSEEIEVIAERDPDEQCDDDELTAAVREAVADEFPVNLAKVHLRDPGWMVKTTSGKVSRADNLAKLERPESVAAQAAPAGDDSLEATVFRTIASTFFADAASITRETVARDVKGWDSLGHTVLMLRLSRAVGIKIPESIAARASNVGNLIDLLENHEATS